MQPITVSKAIHGVFFRVSLPIMLLFLFFISIIIFLAFFVQPHPAWGIVLGVLSIAAPGLLLPYLVIKWMIWAFERVDNLDELVVRGREIGFFRKRVVPTKWLVCTSADAKRLNEAYYGRVDSGKRKIELLDDHSLPKEMVVRGSRLVNIFSAGMCAFFAFYPIERILISYPTASTSDYIVTAIVSLLLLFFIYRAYRPSIKFRLSAEGIWTKRAGFQRWSSVETICFNARYEGKSRITFMVVHYNSSSGLVDKRRKGELRILFLNESLPRIEYAVKIYMKRYSYFNAKRDTATQ